MKYEWLSAPLEKKRITEILTAMIVRLNTKLLLL